MKKQALEYLYYGKKRHISQQIYSKLRTYNKIKPDQYQESKVSGPINKSQNFQYTQWTPEALKEAITNLQKQTENLREQNLQLAKQIKKQQKIDKVISKKIPTNTQRNRNKTINLEMQIQKEGHTKRQDQHNFKNIQTLYQIKLALDVIQLQSILEEKCQKYSKLQNYKKKNNQENINNAFKQQKIKFLSILPSLSQQSEQIISNFEIQDKKLKQKSNLLIKKSNIIKKDKKQKQKNITQLNYQIKELCSTADNRKKRLKKDSCQYYQIENGEVKNQQGIQNQIQTIRQKRKQQNNCLHSFIEQKMLEKISLISQIQFFANQTKNFQCQPLALS